METVSTPPRQLPPRQPPWRPLAEPSVAFRSSAEHLEAELDVLELVVRREILVVRRGATPREKFDEFAGMYVSEEEITAYLAGAGRRPERRRLAEDPELRRLDAAIAAAREELERRVDAALGAVVDLRLARLAAAFELAPPEVRALVGCLAPEADLRFQRYFAYLQNDVAKKRPTVQLLGRMCDAPEEGLFAAHALFGAEAALRRHRLLELPAAAGSETPFPAVQPRVCAGVIGFLAGADRLAGRSAAVAELAAPRPPLWDAAYYRRHRGLVAELGRRHRRCGAGPTYLWGAAGSGKGTLVEHLARDLGRPILRLRGATLAGLRDDPAGRLASLPRDARLHGALVEIADAHELLGRGERAEAPAAAVRDLLRRDELDAVVLTGRDGFSELRDLLGLPLVGRELAYPSIEERYELWHRALPGAASSTGSEGGADLPSRLAPRFRLAPGQIRAAVRSAEAASGGELPRDPAAAERELVRACREESNQSLLRFGRKIEPRYAWSDVVLPSDTRRQLEEICATVHHRRTVYGAWGFEARLSLGKGLTVLFAGPSGTGKTMCAEIVAGDLDLELFKIDLSCVVSKYVGETERNLSRIFDAAQTSNSILFFDEADALFGKRSEVKDAHDRYANIEINYLLQKLEEYEGVVVLATNLKGNLDPAFTRRLSYAVEFPFPDEGYRERIWSGIFPERTPLDAGVDFEFLARKFKLSGGNIKNIAVNSAFLAAANGGRVGMEHLILATRREYQKMGKLCSKSEFGRYYGLIRGEVA